MTIGMLVEVRVERNRIASPGSGLVVAVVVVGVVVIIVVVVVVVVVVIVVVVIVTIAVVVAIVDVAVVVVKSLHSYESQGHPALQFA